MTAYRLIPSDICKFHVRLTWRLKHPCPNEFFVKVVEAELNTPLHRSKDQSNTKKRLLLIEVDEEGDAIAEQKGSKIEEKERWLKDYLKKERRI